MNLYELSENYRQAEAELKALLELDDIKPDVVSSILDSMQVEVEAACIELGKYACNLQATADAIDEKAQKMLYRRRKILDQVAQVKYYIMHNMQRAKIQKIEAHYFNLSVRKNPLKLLVHDESDIDEHYVSFERVRKLNKAKLKEDLKAGMKVPGAKLERSERLDIR